MKSYTEHYFDDKTSKDFLLDEGFKEVIAKLKDLSISIKSKLEKIKDSSQMLAIKALNKAEDVKAFVRKHPSLMWLVVAAMAAGYLAFPHSASAAVANPDQITDLANSMPINLTGSIDVPSITIDGMSPKFDVFFKKVLDISLEGNASPVNVLQDIYKNFGKSLQEFLSNNDLWKNIYDKNPEKAKEIFSYSFDKLANTLIKKTNEIIF
jgi:hypothetical protein